MPPSNKKGEVTLRRHQQEFADICRSIARGREITDIIAFITPGGGKSLFAVIAAAILIKAGIIDKICWVVPRLSLGRQGERSFLDKDFRRLLGHSLEIRSATNEIDPSRGTCGFITTINAIHEDPKSHEDEFRRHRYMLILDEPQHIALGSSYHESVLPLHEAAAIRVLMSGLLDRSDGKRVAFLDYKQDGFGRKSVVDLDDTDTRQVIKYEMTDGLDDKVLIRTYFIKVEGSSKWIDGNGQNRSVETLAGSGDDASAAIFTALRTEYAEHLLKEAIDHWHDHRANVNPRARLLIVAPSISLAKTYLDFVTNLGEDAALATSEETNQALQNIERFKGEMTPSVPILVTVAMAYEGLDVRSCTHIACLTHIRASGWIFQMIARATRYDPDAGDWEDQAAFIIHPDDPLFEDAIQRIKRAQAPYVVDSVGKPGSGPLPPIPANVIPIESAATTVRSAGFDDGENVSADEYASIMEAARQVGLGGLPPAKLKAYLDAIIAVKQNKTPTVEPPIEAVAEKTVTQREEVLRHRIKEFVKSACFPDPDGAKNKHVNIYLIRVYGKPRQSLTESELETIWRNRDTWITAALDLGRWRANSF